MGSRNIGWAMLAGLCALSACGDEDLPGTSTNLTGGQVGLPGAAALGGDGGDTGGSVPGLTAGDDGGATGGSLDGVTAGDTSGVTGGGDTSGSTSGTTAGDSGGASGSSAGANGGTGSNCLMGSGDFSGDGPYTVQQEDVTIGGSGSYTLFYPSPLDDGCLHPVVAWGNGTGVTGSNTYAFYQQHAASWGIVVIASHDAQVGSGEFHEAGLDYLYAQNADASSKFYGTLSDKAGTSGHSQGGQGANAGSSHPNVVAIGNVQGAFGPLAAPAGKAFLCLTGTEDIAEDGCRNAVNGTSSPALYANWEGGTHTGTATVGGWFGGDPGTQQYRRLYTAWFRCFLADDQSACSLFMGGQSCPVCQESGWAEIFANNY